MTIVEATGKGKVDLLKALSSVSAGAVKPSIAAVKVVRKDAAGNVIEEKIVKYGDNR